MIYYAYCNLFCASVSSCPSCLVFFVLFLWSFLCLVFLVTLFNLWVLRVCWDLLGLLVSQTTSAVLLFSSVFWLVRTFFSSSFVCLCLVCLFISILNSGIFWIQDSGFLYFQNNIITNKQYISTKKIFMMFQSSAQCSEQLCQEHKIVVLIQEWQNN